MNNYAEIKKWLDYLYYEIGKQSFDFDLQIIKKDWASKRRKYSEVCFACDNIDNRRFILSCNQRQIFPNEIILDIENKDKLKEITDKLDFYKLSYYIFDTHSRGFHIHIWFDYKEKAFEKRIEWIKEFDADEMLNSPSHMIALEFAEHWKSGKKKERYGNKN